ncbi:MAG: hypothetical protein LLG14_12640 [Nocardiaceae bacterium]|nr:hypothetical protein [Nocardiaceae bacterium]
MPMILDAPFIRPLTGGLFSAASIIETIEPTRLFDGTILRTFNCPTVGSYGTLDVSCGAMNTIPDGTRSEDRTFYGIGVFASDSCDLKKVSRDESLSAARQKLRLQEQQLIEQEFAALLIVDAGVIPAPAAGEAEEIVRAVGELEEEVGYLPSVFHSPLRFRAWAERYRLTTGPNGLFTPNGHRWAFSAGYSAIGNHIIVTGPVHLQRGPVNAYEAIEKEHNIQTQTVQREYLASYECSAIGREVTV